MEKIVLMNVHSSLNAGDAVLLQSALNQLKASFPESQITLSLNDLENYHGDERVVPSLTSWLHPIDEHGNPHWKIGRLIQLLPASMIPVWSKRWQRRATYPLTPDGLIPILRAILDADLVVSAPGGYLYSSGRGISLLILLYSLMLVLWAGKPLYLLPQSIGPVRYWWERRLLRWVLERARLVMVREPVSLRMVRSWGVCNPRLQLVPDMAFAYTATQAGTEEGWLGDQGIDLRDGKPSLGITMINWEAQTPNFNRQDHYELACAVAARRFIELTGGRVIFFPQVCGPTLDQDDRVPARRAVALLQDMPQSVWAMEEPLSMAALQELYGQMDLFIGTRMHSNIFALCKGVPVIAIGYQHKTEGIAEMVGLKQWVIDIQKVDATTLADRLEALWVNRKTWREHIQITVPQLVRQAGQAGEMVREDYRQAYPRE